MSEEHTIWIYQTIKELPNAHVYLGDVQFRCNKTNGEVFVVPEFDTSVAVRCPYCGEIFRVRLSFKIEKVTADDFVVEGIKYKDWRPESYER